VGYNYRKGEGAASVLLQQTSKRSAGLSPCHESRTTPESTKVFILGELEAEDWMGLGASGSKT
jgi:hypothetical protein